MALFFFFWRQGEDGDFSPVASSSQHVHVGSDVACRRLWTNACPQGSRSRHFFVEAPEKLWGSKGIPHDYFLGGSIGKVTFGFP